MSKLGMNVIGMYPEPFPTHWDRGLGIWDDVNDCPNVENIGRLKQVGVKYLRYPGGNFNRQFDLGASLWGKFNLDAFFKCCAVLGAEPIVTVTAHKSAEEAVEIYGHIRNVLKYDGVLYLEMGNESWLGAEKDENGKWPLLLDDETQWYTPAEYAQWFNEVADLFSIDDNLRIVLPVADGWKWWKVENWNSEVKALIDPDSYDYIAVHLYTSPAELGYVSEVLEKYHAMFPDHQIMITEQNMRIKEIAGHPEGHGTHEHMMYLLAYMAIADALDYVHSYHHWAFGYGYWQTIEHDGTPLAHWKAFEIHAEE